MEEDANEILRILLPRRPRIDKVIWHFGNKRVILCEKWILIGVKN